MSAQSLITQRDALLEQLGHCIEYIDQLENSIDRLSVDAVYEDMPETELDFADACNLFSKLNDGE